MKKTTIALVEDHKMLRQMLVKMFADHTRYEVTGESDTLDGAIEMIRLKRPDIVLLDIHLAQGSGLDAVPHIRKFSPGTGIIILSMQYQPAYAKKMFQLGAKGYVTKNSPMQEIFAAIDAVMNGGQYLCKEVKDILADNPLDNAATGPNTKDLSLREIEIIKLMKEGLSSKEISSAINIQLRTVEVHRYNILKKLKLKNTASLINFINNTDLNFG